MSINLLEKVCENLHYPPLQKIDANKTYQSDYVQPYDATKFSQAAIPAVLVSLYKYSTTDEGATEILRRDYSTNWVSKIFDDTKKEVIEKIATYADKSRLESFEQMDNIADEAIKNSQ